MSYSDNLLFSPPAAFVKHLEANPVEKAEWEAQKEARKAEEARKAALEAEAKARKDKVAKGIIGSRSLFGQAGGRGFFG